VGKFSEIEVKPVTQAQIAKEKKHYATWYGKPLSSENPAPGNLWIQEAVEKPGSYRESVQRRYGKAGFTKQGTIKKSVIAQDMQKSGKLGRRARLAKTLTGLQPAPGTVGIKTIPGKFQIGDAVRVPGLSGIARITYIRDSEDEAPKYKLAFRDGSPKYFNESSIESATATVQRETQDTNYYQSFPKDQFYIIRWLKDGGLHLFPQRDREFPEGFSSRKQAETFVEKWGMQDDSRIVPGSEAQQYGVPKRY